MSKTFIITILSKTLSQFVIPSSATKAKVYFKEIIHLKSHAFIS